jgi:hypothetical protein
MSAEKLKERKDDPAASSSWPDCVNAHVLTCGSCGSAGTAAACQVLHWKSGHKIACKRGRVDFALFNIPHIAKSLMPVDNEPKHGGAQSRFAAIWQRQLTSMKKEKIPTEISAAS